MQEIKCPNCGEVFQVDETVYDKIVKQVRDREFDRELERREELLASKNELEIEKLNARLSAASTEKKLAVNQANSEKERELAEKDILISKLKGEIASKDKENKLKTQAPRPIAAGPVFFRINPAYCPDRSLPGRGHGTRVWSCNRAGTPEPGHFQALVPRF